MKKIILIILCMLTLTGCSLEYDITFNEDSISEHIKTTFKGNIYKLANEIEGDGFYLEKEIVENQIPSLKDDQAFYKKEIIAKDTLSTVNLTYDYTYDQFAESYFLDRCFEHVYVNNTEEYIYVSLYGQFNCFYEENLEIKLSTDYKMLETNSNKYKNGKYIWNLNMTDDESNITFMLSKEKDIKKTTNNHKNIITLIVLISATITCLVIFIKNKKRT